MQSKPLVIKKNYAVVSCEDRYLRFFKISNLRIWWEVRWEGNNHDFLILVEDFLAAGYRLLSGTYSRQAWDQCVKRKKDYIAKTNRS